MAAARTTATNFGRGIFRSSPSLTFISTCLTRLPRLRTPFCFISRPISYTPVRCAAGSDSGGGHNKPSARMSLVHQLLHEAKERSAGRDEPIPKITLGRENNRINKDGELVISSTKSRTQKGNIQDALEKLQAIIDAACYVPPPPSEEQVKKINKIAAIAESKRLQGKKVLSLKKAFRRSRGGYD